MAGRHYLMIACAVLLAACADGPRNSEVRAALEEALTVETRERRVLRELGLQSFLPAVESVETRACARIDTHSRPAGPRYLCDVRLTLRQWGVLNTDNVQVVLARADGRWRMLDDPERVLVADDGAMRPAQNQ